MQVGSNKLENVKKACKMVKEAASCGAKLVALPVSFRGKLLGIAHFPTLGRFPPAIKP